MSTETSAPWTTTVLPPRWSHVALNARDPEVTEAFYRHHFGFRRARIASLRSSRVVFLRSGRVQLEIIPTSGPPPVLPSEDDGPTPPGVTRHLAFETEDLDAFLAQLGEDVTVSSGPMAFHEVIPGWRSAWLLDPDGVVIEVSEGYRDQSPLEIEQPTDGS